MDGVDMPGMPGVPGVRSLDEYIQSLASAHTFLAVTGQRPYDGVPCNQDAVNAALRAVVWRAAPLGALARLLLEARHWLHAMLMINMGLVSIPGADGAVASAVCPRCSNNLCHCRLPCSSCCRRANDCSCYDTDFVQRTPDPPSDERNVREILALFDICGPDIGCLLAQLRERLGAPPAATGTASLPSR